MQKYLRRVKYLICAFPIAFTLIFFGFLHPSFDAVIRTDHIIGEGTCSSTLAGEGERFSYLYEGDAYFGSELKTLRLRDLKYNVNAVNLTVQNIQEADIMSFDISVFGFVVTHLDGNGVSHKIHLDSNDITSYDSAPILHISLDEVGEAGTINFTGFRFIPRWIWVYYALIIGLLSALISLVLFIIDRKYPIALFHIANASTILMTLIMGAFFCGSFPYVNFVDFILNWVFLIGISVAINAITTGSIGTIIVCVVTLGFYIANYYVISFRGKPIMPFDLSAVGTAMEVVKGYKLVPSWQMIFSIFISILHYIFDYSIADKSNRKDETKNATTLTDKKQSCKNILISKTLRLIVGIAIVVISLNTTTFKSMNSFAWDNMVLESFHREGMVLSFIKNAENSYVAKPDGYSRERVDEFLSQYSGEKASEGVHPTNIIMVMDEAFSDLREVGLDQNIKVMPFIDSLKEDTIKGNLYVSVYGGGTCNTEFEALTGNSLAFFGNGAYPYTENITKSMFSLASYFKQDGYITQSFHASEAKNWNRNRVYPFLGFEKFNSLIDYPELTDETYLHNLPADIGDYKFMKSVSAENSDKPRFLFGVTIQNHSGYERWNDVEEDETVKKYGSELPEDAQIYLSLVKASDDAVKQLVETYKDSDEPTMIIFFGDHQPGLSNEAMSAIYGGKPDLTYLDTFKTKFFIWTNYETEAESDVNISANFLPWLILKRGGFALPPYIQMLGDVHEKYPVISSQGVIDAEGNVYTGVDALKEDPTIQMYRNIQYANVFDAISDDWFRENWPKCQAVRPAKGA